MPAKKKEAKKVAAKKAAKPSKKAKPAENPHITKEAMRSDDTTVAELVAWIESRHTIAVAQSDTKNEERASELAQKLQDVVEAHYAE